MAKQSIQSDLIGNKVHVSGWIDTAGDTHYLPIYQRYGGRVGVIRAVFLDKEGHPKFLVDFSSDLVEMYVGGSYGVSLLPREG